MPKKKKSKSSKKGEDIKKDKNIPPEILKKMEQMGMLLEKFKIELLKKFDKYIIGIELLPPDKKDEKKSKVNKKEINLLVLVDDSDSKKMSREELIVKIDNIIKDAASKLDKSLKPNAMLVSELKEACFDGKYELLQKIAAGAIIYDKGMLSALKVSEVHKKMVLDKFEKYIVSYVAAGSLFRGDANPCDIDVFVVIDDTDVKRMSRIELKDKLRAIIAGMGFEATKLTGIEAQFHVQTYILTDFWDSIKDANPVIFTLLRDGVPLFDRGVFMPWKLLLQMGRIKPSPEAIDMNMDIGEKLLQRVKHKLLSVVGEDLYYAALNPSQAALMLYGLAPPTPKEAVKLLEDVFVKKEKLLEKRYVNILEKIRKTYKDIEHGKITNITGKEIDSLLKLVEEYLKRIKKLFKELEKRQEYKSLEEIHDSCIAIVRDALRIVSKEKVYDLEKGFKELLVDGGKVSGNLLKIFKRVVKLNTEHKVKRLSRQEVEKINREARFLIKEMICFIQRARSQEIEKAKVRFKYGDKVGELLFLKDIAFLIPDIDKGDEIQAAKVTVSGKLENIRKSSFEELEKHLVEFQKMPKRAFIKQSTLSSLKELIGKEVEIFVSS